MKENEQNTFMLFLFVKLGIKCAGKHLQYSVIYSLI